MWKSVLRAANSLWAAARGQSRQKIIHYAGIALGAVGVIGLFVHSATSRSDLKSPNAARRAIHEKKVSAIGALGRIEPHSEVIQVGAAIDDRLARLVVAEGDAVKAGDVLGYLESHAERVAERNRIAALLREAEQMLEAETRLGQAAVREAELGVRRIKEVGEPRVSGQRTKLQSLKAELANSKDILSSREKLLASGSSARRSVDDQRTIVIRNQESLKFENNELDRLQTELEVDKLTSQAQLDRARAACSPRNRRNCSRGDHGIRSGRPPRIGRAGRRASICGARRRDQSLFRRRRCALAGAEPARAELAFPNSGASAAQDDFRRGVIALHNFEYAAAAKAFRAAQAADPAFALAYWGEAMTYSHPLWGNENPGAARKALERLAPTPAARAAMAPTERERLYLAAVEILFDNGDRRARHQAYEQAMHRLAGRFPEDHEASVFHALAILGLDSGDGEADVRDRIRAAASLEGFFRANPRHPGVVHYLIHAYDDPLHAPLGLRAARAYEEIAGKAPHALHMPSHIYI
jgi:pyruvate/2-oxoglutarate dehydrogenase complex dihydrolipoamide acyltransferase (E2) component